VGAERRGEGWQEVGRGERNQWAGKAVAGVVKLSFVRELLLVSMLCALPNDFMCVYCVEGIWGSVYLGQGPR